MRYKTTSPQTEKATATNGDFLKGDDCPQVVYHAHTPASNTPTGTAWQRHAQRHALHSAERIGERWLVTIREWCQPPVRVLVDSRAQVLEMITGGRA